MRIVLDTNILISGIFWTGAPKKILALWDSEFFDVYTSPEILEEYKEIIQRKSTKLSFNPNILLRPLANKLRLVTPIILKNQICEDPDDDMFIACAIAAKANYIVSGDKKLLATSSIISPDVITAREFLNILEKKK